MYIQIQLLSIHLQIALMMLRCSNETLQRKNFYISLNCFDMYAFKIACWALVFIFRLRFPPGVSIATIVKAFCVHKVFIALFVEYPLCLLYHNLRLHMLKTCSIGKTVLSVSCARFKSHICKLRPPPHFKTKKSLHLPLPEPQTAQYTNIQIVPIFFSPAGEVNAYAGVLLNIYLSSPSANNC